MTSFNPSELAVLHDRYGLIGIVTLTGEQADDFRRSSVSGDDGAVAWKEHVFDGWETCWAAYRVEGKRGKYSPVARALRVASGCARGLRRDRGFLDRRKFIG